MLSVVSVSVNIDDVSPYSLAGAGLVDRVDPRDLAIGFALADFSVRY